MSLGGDWALASNNNSPGEGDITSLRQISTHPPPSKVGFFVFTRPMNEATKQNREANLSYLVSYYYTVRSNDVKVLKSRWNFAKAKTTTPGNNIYS